MRSAVIFLLTFGRRGGIPGGARKSESISRKICDAVPNSIQSGDRSGTPVLPPQALQTLYGEAALELRNSFLLPPEVEQELSGKAQIVAIARGPQTTFVLAVNRQAVKAVVANVSDEGKLVGPLRPAPPSSRSIASEGANLYIQAIGEVVGFDALGRPNPTTVTRSGLVDLCSVDGILVGVSDSGAVVKIGARDVELSEGTSQGYAKIAALPNGKYIVTHGIEGRVATGSIAGGQGAMHTLNVPELQRLRTEYPPRGNLKAVLLAGIASTVSGRVFVTLTGARPETGVSIVELDANGEFVRMLNAPLARFEPFQSAGNPTGAMGPGHIAADDKALILADSRWAVAIYELVR